MSKNRFEDILRNLSFTREEPPPYRDRIFEHREMEAQWNENMQNEYAPSDRSTLDESIKKWVEMYTCPAFMVVPRKPWPFGNEYLCICDCEPYVMYRVEMVEGKDRPPELGVREFDEMGKTVGKMLRLTKPIWYTGTKVTMDSGFCVAKGLVELRKKGVFAAIQVKKRRYWPTHFKGDVIEEHFKDKKVGYANAIQVELEGTKFYIHGMKEPDYVTYHMATYGTSQRIGQQQFRTCPQDGRVSFQYPMIVHDHFSYRDACDNHNGRRMFPIAIEEQLRTHRWIVRGFDFFIALSEVNANSARNGVFNQPLEPQVDFRFHLANEMIDNPYLDKERAEARRSGRIQAGEVKHKLMTCPQYQKFQGKKLVCCKTQYYQKICKCKKKKPRTYCSCSPGVFMCVDCFAEHVDECASG